jgi:hypothetical protein
MVRPTALATAASAGRMAHRIIVKQHVVDLIIVSCVSRCRSFSNVNRQSFDPLSPFLPRGHSLSSVSMDTPRPSLSPHRRAATSPIFPVDLSFDDVGSSASLPLPIPSRSRVLSRDHLKRLAASDSGVLDPYLT